jgi:hypothetical protein
MQISLQISTEASTYETMAVLSSKWQEVRHIVASLTARHGSTTLAELQEALTRAAEDWGLRPGSVLALLHPEHLFTGAVERDTATSITEAAQHANEHDARNTLSVATAHGAKICDPEHNCRSALNMPRLTGEDCDHGATDHGIHSDVGDSCRADQNAEVGRLQALASARADMPDLSHLELTRGECLAILRGEEPLKRVCRSIHHHLTEIKAAFYRRALANAAEVLSFLRTCWFHA